MLQVLIFILRGTIVDPLELQSHFGGNPVKFQVVCPQIGTAVLKGLIGPNIVTRSKNGEIYTW